MSPGFLNGLRHANVMLRDREETLGSLVQLQLQRRPTPSRSFGATEKQPDTEVPLRLGAAEMQPDTEVLLQFDATEKQPDTEESFASR